MKKTSNTNLQLGFEVEQKKDFLQSIGRQKRDKQAFLDKKPKTNDFTKSVVDLLTLKGFKVWRNNNGAVYDVKKKCFRKNSVAQLGVSDVIGYQKKTGRAIFVEIKTGSDSLSDEQREFLIEALNNGCIAFECRHIDDVTRRLRQYDPQGGH